MALFPTLTWKPAYGLTEKREDSVIRSRFEGGYVQTRPRFTRLRRIWDVNYKYMPHADKTALDTFVNVTTFGGADSFTWVHPQADTSHTVRFKEPPVFTFMHSPKSRAIWDCHFVLEEV